MYDAVDITDYILYHCKNKLGIEMTNLKLQKLLYLIEVDYIKQTKESLFNNELTLWQYGWIVEYSYYYYSGDKSYKSLESPKHLMVNIKDNDKNIINKALNKFLPLEHKELIELTKDNLWSKMYVLEGLKTKITTDELIEYILEDRGEV